MSNSDRLPPAETLESQASRTAASWLQDAIREIDKVFGSGYAKEHPELVAAFMKTAGLDEIAMHLRGLALAHQRIDDSLGVLCSRLNINK